MDVEPWGVGGVVTRRSALAAALAAVLISLAACTSSDHASSPSSGPVASTPTSSTVPSRPTSTSPSEDPRGKSAVTAYLAFTHASHAAERKPTDLSLEGALKKYALDPALSTEGQHLFGYRDSGIAWSGSPPSSRVTVASIADGGVYPTAMLTDCPTVSRSWRPYIVKTHKAVPVTFPPGSAKPPHAVSAKVIYYKSHWMVQSTTTNVRKTCAPS